MNDGISLGSYQLSRKVLLSICVAALLSVNFILGYIVHNFYSQGILDVTNPGFWLGILNFSVITGMVLFYKRVDNLSWSDLGLGRPDSWWKPLLVGPSCSFRNFLCHPSWNWGHLRIPPTCL